MRAAHLHLRCRNAPFRAFEIKFSPFGLTKLTRPHKDQRGKPQGELWSRAGRRNPSIARRDAPIPTGSTMAARWVTFGAVKAPRKSTDGSRSALPVAIAYRNTMPQVLRSRRAVSYRPRASTLRRTAEQLRSRDLG